MPTDWQSPESKDRLLAAVLAANDDKKLNYCHLATYYGNGATCASIREQFRPIRKDAEVMKEQVLPGARKDARSTQTNTSKSRGPRGPYKKDQGVLAGKAKKVAKKGLGKTVKSVKKRVPKAKVDKPLEANEATEAVTEGRALRSGKGSIKAEESVEAEEFVEAKDSAKANSPEIEIKDEFDDRDWEIMDSLKNDPNYDD